MRVWFAAKQASVVFKGRSPGSAGLDQINVKVPDGVEGCRVPLAVRMGDVVSNFTS